MDTEGIDGILDQIRGLQKVILERRPEDAPEFYTLPLVIYSVVGVNILRTRKEIIRTTAEFCLTLDELGVASTDFVVVDRSGPYNSRHRLTVKFTDYDKDGVAIRSLLTVLFYVETDTGFLIEMLEFIDDAITAKQMERIMQ